MNIYDRKSSALYLDTVITVLSCFCSCFLFIYFSVIDDVRSPPPS